jgi:hypothetical protein
MNGRLAVLLSSTILVAALIAAGSQFSTILAASAASSSSSPSTDAMPPLSLKTNNGSINVSVDWSPKQLQEGKATQFTINFRDPASGASLHHVNYNLEVKDDNGHTIKSLMNLHTHTGNDVQTITFDTKGNFQLVITVLGLGLTTPFDTTKSGTVETALSVGS